MTTLSKRNALNGTLVIAQTDQGTFATILGRRAGKVTKALMQKLWTDKRGAFSPYDPVTDKFTQVGGMPSMENI